VVLPSAAPERCPPRRSTWPDRYPPSEGAESSGGGHISRFPRPTTITDAPMGAWPLRPAALPMERHVTCRRRCALPSAHQDGDELSALYDADPYRAFTTPMIDGVYTASGCAGGSWLPAAPTLSRPRFGLAMIGKVSPTPGARRGCAGIRHPGRRARATPAARVPRQRHQRRRRQRERVIRVYKRRLLPPYDRLEGHAHLVTQASRQS